jgi:DNA-directed RNA polymerase subunit alpha
MADAPMYSEVPIEVLDLSARAYISLQRMGITTVAELLEMLDRGPDAMLAIRNFGQKSLDELVARLRSKGYLPGADNEGSDQPEPQQS